jgi:hypothetical protein
MRAVDFGVAGWAAWSPEHPDRAAWLAWASLSGTPEPELSPPLLLRRRVTKIGQQALRLAWSLPASESAPIVFASRDGEFSRTVSVLDTLDKPELVSPADFSLSVHHSLAGLLSIARGNRAGHGAVAAGRDSLWCGLIEAACGLTETDSATVLFVYHGEPLPAPFDIFATANDETIALALALTRSSKSIGLRLSATRRDGGDPDPRPGEALLATLLRGEPVMVIGDRQLWHLARTDVVA